MISEGLRLFVNHLGGIMASAIFPPQPLFLHKCYIMEYTASYMDNIVTQEEMSFLIMKHMEKDNVGEIEAKRIVANEGFST